MQKKEQRNLQRLTCEISLSFRRINAEGLSPLKEAVVRDVSGNGLRMRFNEFVSIHDKLLLKFYPPKTTPVETIAQPKWVREVPGSLGQFEIGAQFLTISELEKKALDSFLDDNSRFLQ